MLCTGIGGTLCKRAARTEIVRPGQQRGLCRAARRGTGTKVLQPRTCPPPGGCYTFLRAARACKGVFDSPGPRPPTRAFLVPCDQTSAHRRSGCPRLASSPGPAQLPLPERRTDRAQAVGSWLARFRPGAGGLPAPLMPSARMASGHCRASGRGRPRTRPRRERARAWRAGTEDCPGWTCHSDPTRPSVSLRHRRGVDAVGLAQVHDLGLRPVRPRGDDGG